MDPYVKIMRAAKRRTGLRLTADDVCTLSIDDTIREAATQYRFTSELEDRERQKQQVIKIESRLTPLGRRIEELDEREINRDCGDR